MQTQLTEFLRRMAFFRYDSKSISCQNNWSYQQQTPLTSSQILYKIYDTLNSQKNYKDFKKHKLSISGEDTNSQSPMKCNCKKSKCLKLYCQCFAKGSFCRDCNCDGCNNSNEFQEIRAKAIDEMMIKTSQPFGGKISSVKGCNCKKTGCTKKYCECFNSGLQCTQLCKCSNCSNCSH